VVTKGKQILLFLLSIVIIITTKHLILQKLPRHVTSTYRDGTLSPTIARVLFVWLLILHD
jgi:hypothetical protein